MRTSYPFLLLLFAVIDQNDESVEMRPSQQKILAEIETRLNFLPDSVYRTKLFSSFILRKKKQKIQKSVTTTQSTMLKKCDNKNTTIFK
jgi:hypothetical protein